MMRSNPPPVPPRPSKTVVAEALAKSRRVSPIRVLYATQPTSPESVAQNQKVVPVRSAPPPPLIKPKPNTQNTKIQNPHSPQNTPQPEQIINIVQYRQRAQPQVPQTQVSTNTPPKFRQIEDPKTNSRTLIYQSSNLKTSQNLAKNESQSIPQNEVQDEPQNISQLSSQNPIHPKNSETPIETINPRNFEEPLLCKDPMISKLNELNTKPPENPIDKVIDVIVQSSSDKTTIIVSKDDDNNNKKVQFDDKINHEILIAELQSMKEEQERFLKRQRKAPVELYDRIQHSDWIEVANGEEVRLSSCQIYIEDTNSDDASPKLSKSSSFSSCSSSRRTLQAQRAPSMSSLHGLPPLPKSLSGFSLLDSAAPNRGGYRVSPAPQTPSRAGSSRGTTPPTPGSGSGSGHVVYPPHPAPNSRVNGTSDISGNRGRKLTTLDTQLAVLRREMYGLRQLDLSLLSQLYSLNEAIQDFRQILQDQEDSALSPNSPSPSPSSGDEGDEFYSPAPIRYKPAPPAPPLRRTSNSSSANSSEYGTV